MWLAACGAALAAAVTEMPAIVLGDLNVLEPDHWPRYPFFAPFEYDFYRALAEAHRLTDVFRHLHPDDAHPSGVAAARVTTSAHWLPRPVRPSVPPLTRGRCLAGRAGLAR